MPKKVPNRTVSSSGLIYQVEGVEYRPHENETVTYRSRLTPSAFSEAVRLQAADVTSLDGVDEGMRNVREFIASRIVAWTWTDDDGEAYPSPPTADTLALLDLDEIAWLMENAIPKRSAEETGEGFTPST